MAGTSRLNRWDSWLGSTVVWAVDDLKIAIRITLKCIHIPLAPAVGFVNNVTGTPLFRGHLRWIAGMRGALGEAILTVDVTRIVLKKECFLDGRKRWFSGKHQEGRRGSPYLHS